MREYAALSVSKRVVVERGRSNRGAELDKIPVQFQKYLNGEGITYRQWKLRQKRAIDPDLAELELRRRKLALNKNRNVSEYHHKYKIP